MYTLFRLGFYFGYRAPFFGGSKGGSIFALKFGQATFINLSSVTNRHNQMHNFPMYSQYVIIPSLQIRKLRHRTVTCPRSSDRGADV